MERNIYFDLLSVVIILGLAGYYLIPWFWEKLHSKQELQKYSRGNSPVLTMDYLPALGLFFIGLLWTINPVSWFISFVSFYLFGFFSSSSTEGELSFLPGYLIMCGILFTAGIIIILFAPKLTARLLRVPPGGRTEVEKWAIFLRTVLVTLATWLIVLNLPYLLAVFIFKMPDLIDFIRELFTGSIHPRFYSSQFWIDPQVFIRFITVVVGIVIFLLPDTIVESISKRYYYALKEKTNG
ncbi:MAG: hypothetical protein ACLFN5_04030 [bacterium]